MLFSEAIRLGSMVTTQCYGTMFDWPGSACAIGSAYVAMGFDPKTHAPFSSDKYKKITKRIEDSFASEIDVSSVLNTIILLNDYDHLTREDIADWLVSSGNDFDVKIEPCEQQEDTKPVACDAALSLQA